MTIEFHRLGAHIGARVSGVDTTAPLTEADVDRLRAGLATHRALVLDATGLDSAGQERFAQHLGELTTAHPTVPGDPTPHVLEVDGQRNKANEWHSDVTFVVNPPSITTLRSIVVPSYGGETLVANAVAAYEALPAELAALADSLWAVHTNVYDYADPTRNRSTGEQQYRAVFESVPFESAHPVVRQHPGGERSLFIGAFVKQLVGFNRSDSADLLRILQSYVTRPEHVLRWAWQPEQLLVFDNRTTQHYAVDNYDDQPRRLSRVTVGGDVPVSVTGEPSRALTGDSSTYSDAPATERGAA